MVLAPGPVQSASISIPAASRIREIAEWLPARPAGPGVPISERSAWDRLATNAAFAGVVAGAARLAAEPVPALPDDLYLDYSKTGNRTRAQAVTTARDERLRTLALAECLENRGRFVPPLIESLKAACEERTWVLPAHDDKLDNFHGRVQEPDLRATRVAWELATCDWLLGPKLSPATRQLIKENVRRRVTLPFREIVEGKRPPHWWLTATHNWNAVCLCGVTGAALALEESREDRAFYVASAEKLVQSFLSGFTPDGYCSEGVGYWNYGFGRFVMMSENVRRATSGRLDWLAAPEAYAPALFGFRTEIANGIYPTTADCPPGSRPEPQLLWFIQERFGLPPSIAAANGPLDRSGALAETALLAFTGQPLPPIKHPDAFADSPLRIWFKDGGVLICRPAAQPSTIAPIASLAVLLKGGNNAEHHNHNDLGTFAVVSGKSMLVCDPGSEVYTSRTFSNRRYDSKVLSSYGHPVPVIAGKLQRTGAAAKAIVLQSSFTGAADVLALDLRSAYEVPSLTRLERTFTYRRGPAPSLTVTDAIAFQKPETYETALITWGQWKQTQPGEFLVTENGDSVKVTIDARGRAYRLRSETIEENLPRKLKPVRIAIALDKPVTNALITMTIRPVANGK